MQLRKTSWGGGIPPHVRARVKARRGRQVMLEPGQSRAGKRQARAGTEVGTGVEAGEGTGAVAVAGKMERQRQRQWADRTGHWAANRALAAADGRQRWGQVLRDHWRRQTF